MRHVHELHINVGDSLEGGDAVVREYIHDAIEAMEHGLTANEFRMRESVVVTDVWSHAV